MGNASLNISARKLYSLNLSARNLYTLNLSARKLYSLNLSARVISAEEGLADVLSIQPATVTVAGQSVDVVEGAAVADPLLTDLVFWYTGEDANDSHTGAHHLTPVNSPTHVSGKIGNAFQPSKGDSRFWRISSASAAHADPRTSDFSISYWIKVASSSGNDGIIGMGRPNNTITGFSIDTRNTDDTVIWLSDGTVRAGAVLNTGSYLDSSRFDHVVVNFDRSGNADLYINKVLVQSIDISSLDGSDIVSGADFNIGNTESFGKSDSTIDDICMWHRLLTTAEIDRLHDDEITYSDL